MNEEILSRLDVIASKLGVAAEHLWGILTKQALVAGSYAAILLCLGGVLLYLGSKVKVEKYWIKDDYWTSHPTVEGIKKVLLILIGAWITAYNLYQALVCFINPEYYAYVKLVNLLK